MSRLTDSLLLAIVIGGAIWTYQIKHEAETSAKRIASLKKQIVAQDRKIALLEADWAIETSPARLRKIAKTFEEQLQLVPMESSQIIDTSELPGFRLDRDQIDGETFAKRGESIITGGIGDLIEREESE